MQKAPVSRRLRFEMGVVRRGFRERQSVSVDARVTAARQPRKVSVGVEKLPILGKIDGKLAGITPNHWARVPPYWSTDVVGIHRPLLPASFGPPRASCGNWP